MKIRLNKILNWPHKGNVGATAASISGIKERSQMNTIRLNKTTKNNYWHKERSQKADAAISVLIINHTIHS